MLYQGSCVPAYCLPYLVGDDYGDDLEEGVPLKKMVQVSFTEGRDVLQETKTKGAAPLLA